MDDIYPAFFTGSQAPLLKEKKRKNVEEGEEEAKEKEEEERKWKN